jgi:hypothetical protein
MTDTTTTISPREELKSLTESFRALHLEITGEDDRYLSPDLVHIRKMFAEHPNFKRWEALHSASVMGDWKFFGCKRY